MNKLILAAALSALGAAAMAAPQANPLWLRNTAISPDGQTIAFTYRGDIYTVPFAGGAATRITTDPAVDSRPVWSPDGRKIAHTIDPVTGRSAVSRLLSATVFCDNAARADALGTMFMSLGSERAVAKARELEREGVMAYFIFATEKADGRQRDESPDDYETWASPALEKLLKR